MMFLSCTVIGEEKPVTMATKSVVIHVPIFIDEILAITRHFDHFSWHGGDS